MKKFKFIKLIGLFLSLILAVMLIVGCEEEPFQPQKPVEVTHTVRVMNSIGGTISPSGIIEVTDGSSLELTVTSYPGYETPDSVYVNDILVPLYNGTLSLENISFDYNVKPEIFKMTEQTRLLTQKPWVTFYCTWRGVKTDYYDYSDYIYGEDSVLFSVDKYYPFDPHSTYDPNHAKLETFNKAGVKIGDYTYEIRGDSLVFPDAVNNCKIIELSENSLIIESRAFWNLPEIGFCDSIISVMIYKHPGCY